MDQNTPLKISHDVSQGLQRKMEGLADVERAFVHVDYEHDHDIAEEHKPLYEPRAKRRSIKEVLMSFKRSTKNQTEKASASEGGVLPS